MKEYDFNLIFVYPETDCSFPKCSSDCIFNGTEIFNHGHIDRSKLLSAVQEYFVGTDKGFAELHENAVDHCMEVHKKMQEKHASKPKTDGEHKCDKSKGKFAKCLHRYYFRNCPAAVWTNCMYINKLF